MARLLLPLRRQPATVPFKLGTFDVRGQEKVGLVLRETMVVDIAAANQEYERRNSSAAKVRAPADMSDLIARYDAEVGPRLRELARFATDAGAANYIHPMSAVEDAAAGASGRDPQCRLQLSGTCGGHRRAGICRRSGRCAAGAAPGAARPPAGAPALARLLRRVAPPQRAVRLQASRASPRRP